MYTFGQYLPGNSIIHRLDPRVKILSVVLLSIVLLSCQAPGGAVLTVFLSLSVHLSHLPLRKILNGLRPLAIILLLLFLLHLFSSQGTPISLFGWKTGLLTYEGLRKGALLTWQFLLMGWSGLLLVMTTSPTELVCGIERLLRPLERLRVPSHDVAVMVSLALRSVPMFLEETRRIKEAQVSRGGDPGTGSIPRRARATLRLLLPLVWSILRRADELADAMEGRGYRRGPRTYPRELRLSRNDYIAIGVMVLVLGLPSLSFSEGPSKGYLLDQARFGGGGNRLAILDKSERI